MANNNLLDALIVTCTNNAGAVPALKLLGQALRTTTPVAHRWRGEIMAKAAVSPLPGLAIDLPDPAMCLYSTVAVAPYRFCIDIDSDVTPRFKFIRQHRWELRGILGFQREAGKFDLLPLVTTARSPAVMLDMQLHYSFDAGAWHWMASPWGPINALIYSGFIDGLTPEAKARVDVNIQDRGRQCAEYLGSYLQYLQQPGQYHIVPASPGRVKLGKDGRVRKYYQLPSVGFKEFISDENKSTTVQA